MNADEQLLVKHRQQVEDSRSQTVSAAAAEFSRSLGASRSGREVLVRTALVGAESMRVSAIGASSAQLSQANSAAVRAGARTARGAVDAQG